MGNLNKKEDKKEDNKKKDEKLEELLPKYYEWKENVWSKKYTPKDLPLLPLQDDIKDFLQGINHENIEHFSLELYRLQRYIIFMNIEEEIRDLKSYYGSENPGSLQKNTVMKIMKAGKFDKFLEQQGINVSDFVDQKLEKNTYVHNDVFSTKIRPWFKENDIEDTLVSLPSNNMYPQFVANGYDDYHNAFMMVPMIMVVGIFVGRYVYQKFMKKTPDKKKKCLQKKEQAKEEQNQEYCA